MTRPGAIAQNMEVTLNPAAAGCNLAPGSALLGDERACLVRIYDTAFIRGSLNAQGLFTLNMNAITLFSKGINQEPDTNGLAGASTTYRVKTLDEDGAPHSCLVWRANSLAIEVASPVMALSPSADILTTGLIESDRAIEGGEEVAGLLAQQVLESYTMQMRRKNETCSYMFGNLIQFNCESGISGYKAVQNGVVQLSWTRDLSCCILFPAGTKNSKPLTIVLTPNADVVGGTIEIQLGTAFYAAAFAAANSAVALANAAGGVLAPGDDVAVGFAVRVAPLGFFDETIANPGLCGPEIIDEAQMLAVFRKLQQQGKL